jgi:hypothetical protein
LGAREEAAASRASAAPIAARARVDALLAGVPAPLLALSGARASAALTADQRLALENYLLAQQAAELRAEKAEVEAKLLRAQLAAAAVAAAAARTPTPTPPPRRRRPSPRTARRHSACGLAGRAQCRRSANLTGMQGALAAAARGPRVRGRAGT